MHAAEFKDFILKPEVLRAIADAGFEHPSEVQNQAIPHALSGMDVLCQARSGMGKTAVFVLSTLNQLQPKDKQVSVIVLCHTREMAFQIGLEYQRFAKFLPAVKSAVLFGGVPRQNHIELLKATPPHIVVGTPGRVMDMIEEGVLDVSAVKFFVLDECDKMLEAVDMRRQVMKVFMKTPPQKQVMMYSATIDDKIRPICHKSLQDVSLVFPAHSSAARCPLPQRACPSAPARLQPVGPPLARSLAAPAQGGPWPCRGCPRRRAARRLPLLPRPRLDLRQPSPPRLCPPRSRTRSAWRTAS